MMYTSGVTNLRSVTLYAMLCILVKSGKKLPFGAESANEDQITAIAQLHVGWVRFKGN